MLLYTAFAIALVAVANASPRKHARILGGDDVFVKDYPYIVSLQYNGTHRCGGSILSANYILTSAHCLHKEYELDLISVRSGTTFKNREGKVVNVESYVRHDEYFTERYAVQVNDVAVVKTKESLVFDENTQPIKMFEAGETFKKGADAVVSGWGMTLKEDYVDHLQSVVVQMWETSACDRVFVFLNGIHPGQICAHSAKGGKDSCHGDSGGPLVIDGRLAGIVSWGIACGSKYYPGVYTDVAYFREWIDKHVVY